MRAISYHFNAPAHSSHFYPHTLLYVGFYLFLIIAFVSCGAALPAIALAPYAHSLVVQATFADNTSKLWSTDIASGKQQILQVGAGGNLPTPVQLLGWDRLPIS